MSKALIPGSFDPVTLGHLDIIERTSRIFDEVVVLVAKNSSKNCMLCSEKRAALIEDAAKHLKNVTVDIFDGLLVDYAKSNNIDVTVKGIRNVKDYDYEQNMAEANSLLSYSLYARPFETLYLPCSKDYSDVSSTVVRLILTKRQDEDALSKLVPNAKLLLSLIKQ